MSHPYMVQATLGDPPRSAYEEIQEEEHTQLNHAHDVLPRCYFTVKIMQASIGKGIFLDGSEVREVLYAIMAEAHESLMYQRKCWRTGAEETEEPEEL